MSWPATVVSQDTMHLAREEQHLVVELLVATVRARHDQGLTPWTLLRIRQEGKRICASLDIDLAAARQRAKAGGGGSRCARTAVGRGWRS